jgi:hypothetical protein
MISVILYGRNDNHGYNLHKRAAISFNALAEVLTDEGDEILFVDYNTPEDHPTFPEAIGDTLTEKARRLMRIFRVRPELHARFRGHTHLVALEAQSRNVALRRSNPGNRWILYTNTDMLLVPRDEDDSLSDILAALPDGFYQAPRFELPEMLWEAAFNRLEPADNLAKLREWAKQFHLNQVVHNFLPMRFDALGDFQAALREDMFAIHGFNEAMIHGWHCDSNIAARLSLYRGSPDSVADKLFAYHCDHTRVAASNNSGRRTRMNSQNRYIWDVTTPFLPAQAENWGWPDAEIEEVRLQDAAVYQRFVAGVSAAVEPAVEPFRTTNLEWHLYYDMTYDLKHTISFVCDQLLTLPRSINVAVIGTRGDFLTLFARAWIGMGFRGKLFVPAEFADMPADLPGVEILPYDVLIHRVHAFIFEFGVASQGIDDPVRTGRRASGEDRRRLRIVERYFRHAASVEAKTRPKDRRMQRRFIGVNVIYNEYWRLFTGHVTGTIGPFCSQVLAGYVRRDRSVSGILRWMRGRCGI